MKNKGYTLIEILVTIAILGIIVTMVFVSFRSYEKKRNLETAVQQIKTMLETASIKSLAPEEPASGGSFDGFAIWFDQSSACGGGAGSGSKGTFSLYGNKDGSGNPLRNGAAYEDFTEYNYELPNNVCVDFQPAHGGANHFYVYFGAAVDETLAQNNIGGTTPSNTTEDPALPYYRAIYFDGTSSTDGDIILCSPNCADANKLTRTININTASGGITVK